MDLARQTSVGTLRISPFQWSIRTQSGNDETEDSTEFAHHIIRSQLSHFHLSHSREIESRKLR
ncbi:hypothetical protein CEXT_52241, partial [Caerostris extrusa]